MAELSSAGIQIYLNSNIKMHRIKKIIKYKKNDIILIYNDSCECITNRIRLFSYEIEIINQCYNLLLKVSAN